MLNDFRQREIRRLRIEVAFHNVQVWCRLTEEVVRLPVCDVAQADDLADLAWCEEFPELVRMSGH